MKDEKCFAPIIKSNKISTNLSLNMVSIETVSTLSKLFPSHVIDGFVEIEFEGELFYVYEKYDEWLKIWYNDYMQLPPV